MTDSDPRSTRPIYFFPGIIRDYHVFLPLVQSLPNATLMEWVDPEPQETLQTYAKRMAEKIPTSECLLVGVSFGGVVAQEVARIIQPQQCFLVSSIRHPRELPRIGRLLRYVTGRTTPLLLRAAGHVGFLIPRFIWYSGTLRLRYFTGPHGDWFRWATSEVINWKPGSDDLQTTMIQIHGQQDRTFPIKYLEADVVIQDAGHSLAISHPREVAERILERLKGTSESA